MQLWELADLATPWCVHVAATLRVAYSDGSKRDVRVPVETWLQHTSFTLVVSGKKPVVSATLDPQHVLPEADRSNNTFVVR